MGRKRGVPAAMGGFTTPTLAASNHRVYVGAVTTKPGAPNSRAKNLTTSVFSVPVDGHSPLRKEIDNAFDPIATGHWLYYVTRRHKKTRVHRRNLTTGQTQVLRRGESGCRFAGLAAHHRTVAWLDRCKHRRSRVVILRGETPSARTILRARRRSIGSLRATARYVGFGVGGGPYKEYYYDLKQDQLFRFGHKGNGSGELDGHGAYFVSCTWPDDDPCHYQLVHLK